MDEKMANPIQPVREVTMTVGDAYMPMLRLKYKDEGVDPNSPTPYCALTIQTAGSGGSKVSLFLDIGASATSYVQYQFSAYATVTTDPRSVATTINYTQCTTIKALIAAINAVTGMTCHRLHCSADYSIDTNDFAALAVTQIGSLFKDVLYRDSDTSGASGSEFQMRFGVPADVNGMIGNGRLELVHINGYINGTAAQMSLSQDPNETDESEEVLLGYSRTIPDAAWTELFDRTKGPGVYNGPLLLQVWDSGAGAIADAGTVTIAYRNVEV